MPTYVLPSLAGDGVIQSSSGASWAAAFAGSALVASAAANPFSVGGEWTQDPDTFVDIFSANQVYLEFDTGSIPDTDTVTGATLELFADASYKNVTVAGSIEALVFDWGGTVEGADWRTTAQLGALTRAASRSFNATGSDWTTGYTTITEVGTSLRSAVSVTAPTRLLVTTSGVRTGSLSGLQGQIVSFQSGNGANPPRLTVTTTAGVAPTAPQLGSGGTVPDLAAPTRAQLDDDLLLLS